MNEKLDYVTVLLLIASVIIAILFLREMTLFAASGILYGITILAMENWRHERGTWMIGIFSGFFATIVVIAVVFDRVLEFELVEASWYEILDLALGLPVATLGCTLCIIRTFENYRIRIHEADE